MSHLSRKPAALAVAAVLATGAVVVGSDCTSNVESRTVMDVNQIASTSALTITLIDVVLEPARTTVTYNVSSPDESKVHFAEGPQLLADNHRVIRLRRTDFQADVNGEVFTDVYDPAPDGAQSLTLTWRAARVSDDFPIEGTLVIPLAEDIGKALLAGETASIDYEFTLSGAPFTLSEISPSATLGLSGDGRRGFTLLFESPSDVSRFDLRYQIDTIESAKHAVDSSGLVHTVTSGRVSYGDPSRIWRIFEVPISTSARSLTLTFRELRGRSDVQDNLVKGPWTFTVPLP